MRSLLSITATIAVASSTLPINTLALSTTKINHLTTSPLSNFNSPLLPLIDETNTILLQQSTVEEETLERTSTANTKNDNNNNLSPFLQEMVDEQRELQMNVGKALDTLRKDYPDFLKRAPDYSIYHPSITLKQSDNDQLSVSTLKSYKQTFGVIRTILSLLYDTDRTVIQSRMVYDATKTQIRVSFNAKLIPKSLITRPIHIDGISVYSIDLSRKQYIDTNTKEIQVNDCAGKIIEHKLDKLLVNGQPLAPPYLNVFGLDGMVGNRQGALVGAGAWS